MTDHAALIADAVEQVASALVSVQVDGEHPQYLQTAKANLAKVIAAAMSELCSRATQDARGAE